MKTEYEFVILNKITRKRRKYLRSLDKMPQMFKNLLPSMEFSMLVFGSADYRQLIIRRI